MYKLLPLLLISSCSTHGGLGVHDTAFDSEFREKKVVGWIQGDLTIIDEVNLYIRHESMLGIDEHKTERGGYGVNTMGIYGTIDWGN